MCFLLCFHLVQGSRFRWRLRRFLYWGDARKWHLSHQSLLRYEGRNRLTCMVSDPSAQSSPILVLGVTHRVFSSAQDDDTRGWKGSHLGDMLRVLELAVLYYDTSSPLREGARQRRRMDPRSGVKDYVRLPVSLKRHPDRSGGILLAER